MNTFTERPDELTPELREAGEWLRAEVERVAAEKGVEGIEWRLLYGKRESGGTGGVPSISQWGYQVAGVRGATRDVLPLQCFLDEETVTENQALAQRILDLWTDRVETGGIPDD
jgi:hypothetical protein